MVQDAGVNNSCQETNGIKTSTFLLKIPKIPSIVFGLKHLLRCTYQLISAILFHPDVSPFLFFLSFENIQAEITFSSFSIKNY